MHVPSNPSTFRVAIIFGCFTDTCIGAMCSTWGFTHVAEMSRFVQTKRSRAAFTGEPKARSFIAISLEMGRGRNQVLIQNGPDIMPEICENQYVIRSDWLPNLVLWDPASFNFTLSIQRSNSLLLPHKALHKPPGEMATGVFLEYRDRKIFKPSYALSLAF